MKYLLMVISCLTSINLNAAIEADYVKQWCQGQIEYRLPDLARVDCLTATHAIEADYAHKWAESIGQSLYYASQTGKAPGILLIVDPGDWRFAERLFEAIQRGGQPIRVWFVEVRSE